MLASAAGVQPGRRCKPNEMIITFLSSPLAATPPQWVIRRQRIQRAARQRSAGWSSSCTISPNPQLSRSSSGSYSPATRVPDWGIAIHPVSAGGGFRQRAPRFACAIRPALTRGWFD